MHRFEVHITLKVLSWDPEAQSCQIRYIISRYPDMKLTFIELSSGTNARQAMLTFCTVKPALSSVMLEIKSRTFEVDILRVKVEMGASSIASDAKPAPGQYFEFHILVQTHDPTLLSMHAKAIDEDLRVSRSPFKTSNHFFLTLRDFHGPRDKCFAPSESLVSNVFWGGCNILFLR